MVVKVYKYLYYLIYISILFLRISLVLEQKCTLNCISLFKIIYLKIAPTRQTKIEKHQQGLQCQNLISCFHEVQNAPYDYNHPYALLIAQTKKYYALKRCIFSYMNNNICRLQSHNNEMKDPVHLLINHHGRDCLLS